MTAVRHENGEVMTEPVEEIESAGPAFRKRKCHETVQTLFEESFLGLVPVLSGVSAFAL